MVFEGVATAENAANYSGSIDHVAQSRNRFGLLYGIEKNYELVDAVGPDLTQSMTMLDQLLGGGLQPFSNRQLYFCAVFGLP